MRLFFVVAASLPSSTLQHLGLGIELSTCPSFNSTLVCRRIVVQAMSGRGLDKIAEALEASSRGAIVGTIIGKILGPSVRARQQDERMLRSRFRATCSRLFYTPYQVCLRTLSATNRTIDHSIGTARPGSSIVQDAEFDCWE